MKFFTGLLLLTQQLVVDSQWVQVAQDIDGAAARDWAGGSEKGIAMNGAGTSVAVGSSGHDSDPNDPNDNAGHVRVFDLDNGIWTQRGSDIDGVNSGDNAGATVVMSTDGLVVGVGEPNSEAGNTERFERDFGQVRVFAFEDGDWQQRGAPIAGDERCDFASSGGGLAMDDSGSTIVVGAYGSNNGDILNSRDQGQVRVFDWDGSDWVQRGADLFGEAPGDWFGESVDVDASGNTVAVGALFNDSERTGTFGCVVCRGSVRVFDWDGSMWKQRGSDIDGMEDFDYSGSSVSLDSSGNLLAVGSPQTNAPFGHPEKGAVNVYEWNGHTWQTRGQRIEGESDGDNSGSSVVLSHDGNVLAIGAYLNDGSTDTEGHVRVFDWTGSEWIQRGEDIDGENKFDYSGYSVDLSADGSVVASGARFTDDGAGFFAGHVRVFEWQGDDPASPDDDPAPSSSPTEKDVFPECQDDPSFRKGKREQTCAQFLRRNAEAKCQKRHGPRRERKTVADFCARTCEEFGLGPCAFTLDRKL